MRHVRDLNLIFVHVPKTGGVSVEQVLDEHYDTWTMRHRWDGKCGRHCLPEHLQVAYPWYETCRKFTVVREPVGWYVSNWRYLSAVRQHRIAAGSTMREWMRWYNVWHPQRWMAERLDEDFGRWVERIAEDWPQGHYSWLLRRFCGEPGWWRVDYVARLETLEDDLAEVLGTRWPVPRANASGYPAPEVSDAVRGIIVEREREVIERYYGPDTIGLRKTEDWR